MLSPEAPKEYIRSVCLFIKRYYRHFRPSSPELLHYVLPIIIPYFGKTATAFTKNRLIIHLFKVSKEKMTALCILLYNIAKPNAF